MKNAIQIYKYKSLISMSGFLLLAACSSVNLSKPSSDASGPVGAFDASKLGQSRQSTDFDNDSKSRISDFKTIAVTDISYSQKEPSLRDDQAYGEIRGLTGSIKGMLLKSGYRVAQAKPNVPQPNQNDEFFDIVKRIDAGDFGDADYVLYGVLTSLSQNTHAAPILGSNNQMAIHALEIAVDFSLIDTKTHQVVASFLATGSASDSRIDGVAEGYKPSMPRMFQQMATSLAESVAHQLASQDFVTSEWVLSGKESREIPGTEKYRNEERHLRVYK